jgi:hypothetical protein
MSTKRVPPEGLLGVWEEHVRMGASGVFGLLIGGHVSETEREIGAFMRSNRAALHDMSGVYCALAVVGFAETHSDGSDATRGGSADARTGFRYLTSTRPEELDQQSVYGVARALDIDVGDLPALFLSADPWSTDKTLVLSVGDVVARSTLASRHRGDDRWWAFFSALFDACVAAGQVTPKKRLDALEDDLVERLGKASLGGRLLRTGVLAQIVEGIVAGLT